VKIHWTAAARQDRRNIVTYIRSDSPRAAFNMDKLFSDTVAKLANFPMLGAGGAIPGTRELFPHESYRLVYEIDGEIVWVLALVHVARRWPPVTDYVGSRT
jgi:toxin ParE1/3/4